MTVLPAPGGATSTPMSWGAIASLATSWSGSRVAVELEDVRISGASLVDELEVASSLLDQPP